MRSDRVLPRAAAGTAADGVSALLERVAAAGVECHSLMVVRHGHVVAEGWWTPYSPERPHLLYSLTKSFGSIAVGLAIESGRLRLDDRIVDVLPDHVPESVSPRAAQLTVHHLLSMTTGHRSDTLERAWALEPDDLVRGFLRLPPDEPPGARHAYDNTTTYLLTRMIERALGRTVPDLLAERVFGPMGVTDVTWERLRGGATFGFHGLYLTTEAVAAFGELLLRGGRWQGRQLIPAEWVALATRRHVGTRQFADGTREADWLVGYGYQFWRSRHGYRGDGAMGQLCLVVPEYGLVVAVTAATWRTQVILDAVWDCLLPALDGTPTAAPRGAGPGPANDPAAIPDGAGGGASDDPAANAGGSADGPAPDRLGPAAVARAERELADRLARLALPPVPGEHRPDRRAAATVAADDTAPASAEPGPTGPVLPAGSSIGVEPRPGGWTMRIEAGTEAFEVPVGHGDWWSSAPLGRPVAAAGAWQGSVFVADLVVVTSPSRVRVTVGPAGATVAWNLVPLVGPPLLPQLRAPLVTRPDRSGVPDLPIDR
ncbi:serine hydrolase domain-containing protein [Actinocatenispora thailandica]|uniref:serine hydrolase domain-containing protein n=1 Tax=Actinocatenispora thailandica TaxID=227318 RepID=UPI001EF38EA5|nr:serine hydrolase domain-containing protein [Actinocatenispora thailandica]